MIQAASVEIDITPPIGVMMAGYGVRQEANRGIHDPLKAQVLQIKSGDDSVLIITLDLLAVQTQFSDELRAAISHATGIPRNHILLACSHTHSGPQGFNLDDAIFAEKRDDALQEITLRKISGACRWAGTLLQPAKLSLGFSRGDGVGLNRNDPLAGASDQQVSVLRVDDLNGKPLAILYNYGCHPTVMGADNLLISADYPGAARVILQGVFPGAVIHFTNSAAGDVSTRFTRRSATFEEVERIGQIMAGAVLQAMNNADAFEADYVSGHLERVDLPLKVFPSVDEIKGISQSLKEELARMRAAQAPAAEMRKLVTKAEGAEILLQQSEQYAGKVELQAELQRIRVGPLTLIGVPGEPFSRTFLDIKEQTKPAQVMLIGYANDCKGYFPETAPGLPSTYENYVSPFSSDAALNIKSTAIKLIKDLQ